MANKRHARGLGGRGLGAYFGEELEERENETAASEVTAAEKTGGEIMLKTALIQPNAEQPRKDFGETELLELTESIKKYGIIQPIVVQKKGMIYEIIAGERRWRAARNAGLEEVPVIVRDYTRQQGMEIALIENIQRENLNPVEEARAYLRLIEEFTMTQEEVAEKVSKSRSAIANSLRLLRLTDSVLDMLRDGRLSMGHARALITLDDAEKQESLAKKICEENLSVRDVEREVKNLLKGGTQVKKRDEKADSEAENIIYRDLEEKLRSSLGTKVNINRKDSSKGRIEIEYYSKEELERIVCLLKR